MKQKITIWGRSICLNKRIVDEYEENRVELTVRHAKCLLLTESITEDTICTEEELAEKLEIILQEILLVGEELSDPIMQKKLFDAIS